MTPQDWRDLASVYRAGVTECRITPYNRITQRAAEVCEAMAARCEEIALEREDTDR